MRVLSGRQISDIRRIKFCGLSVSQKSRPKGWPRGVEDFFLRNVSAEFQRPYSKTQSSYWSISFMQGVVSKTGGTEAGRLPKYRNDINININ